MISFMLFNFVLDFFSASEPCWAKNPCSDCVGGSVPNDSGPPPASPSAGLPGVRLFGCSSSVRLSRDWNEVFSVSSMECVCPCRSNSEPMPVQLKRACYLHIITGRDVQVMCVCGPPLWGSSFPRHQTETLDKSVWQIHKSIRLKFSAGVERDFSCWAQRFVHLKHRCSIWLKTFWHLIVSLIIVGPSPN